MISLHDHRILQFCVDAAEKQLRLTTVSEDAGSRSAVAQFDGLAGYVVDGDALGTIIFDVEEVDPIELYVKHAEQLRATYARSGGHGAWVESTDSARRMVSSQSVRGFELSSSIGCTGAIWARSFEARWEDTSGDAA